MTLYLVEFEEKSTRKLREPYLLGENGLYDLAKELDPDISVDLTSFSKKNSTSSKNEIFKW